MNKQEINEIRNELKNDAQAIIDQTGEYGPTYESIIRQLKELDRIEFSQDVEKALNA